MMGLQRQHLAVNGTGSVAFSTPPASEKVDIEPFVLAVRPADPDT